MDPLSEILSLVKPRCYGAGALTGGGRWAFDFKELAGAVKCFAVVNGECLVLLEGEKEPVHLGPDDCLMLPHGRPFRLCSDLQAPPVDARLLVSGAPYNGIRAFAPGEDFVLIGGHFALEGHAQLLLDVLPAFVHLKQGAGQASLRGPVEQMMTELRNPQPGWFLAAQQSVYSMLVLVLRMHLEQDARGGMGWLSALAHPQLGRAMKRIHEAPSHPWTVQMLADTAHMSRTSFAGQFRRTVGQSPLEYLTRWRMRLAADRLVHSKDSVSDIARAAGYESESAFSAAFKRRLGVSPRRYAHGRRG